MDLLPAKTGSISESPYNHRTMKIEIATNDHYTAFIINTGKKDDFIYNLNGILKQLRRANNITIDVENAKSMKVRNDDAVGIMIIEFLCSQAIPKVIISYWFRMMVGLDGYIDDIVRIIIEYGNKMDVFDFESRSCHQHIKVENVDELMFSKMREIDL